MAIPLFTTTITVKRPVADPNLDPYDVQPEPQTVAQGVRAHISTSSGEENVRGGEKEIVEFRVSCDPIAGGLKHTDTIIDERTNEPYEVIWSSSRYGFGIDHEQARLERIRRGGRNIRGD